MKRAAFALLALVALPSLALAQPASKAPVPPPPPPAADPAKPSAEILALGAALNGTWKCKGKIIADDGASLVDATGTLTNKFDLDKFAVQQTWTSKRGKVTHKYTGFITYNPVEKKFTQVNVDNGGNIDILTSAGMDQGMAGKQGMAWDGESRLAAGAPGSTTVKSRAVENHHAKGDFDVSGDYSFDSGKTWKPVYTLSCKK